MPYAMYNVGKIDKEPFDWLNTEKMIVEMLKETNTISFFGKGHGGTIHITYNLLKSITQLIERRKDNYSTQDILKALEIVTSFKKQMDSLDTDELIIYFI